VALIRPAVHRGLDFLTVTGFAVAPFLLALSGPAAWLAWVLAVVHLAMTGATTFPDGPARFVSFRLHGLVEFLVGIALPALPLAAGWSGTARWFYLIAGGAILIVRLASSPMGGRQA
jgi:hypothetical protein